MDIESVYHILGFNKVLKIIIYINYNECSFTAISQNCNVNSGQLTRLLNDMVKANIIIKRTEPNNTFYKLDELGIIIVKHMIEIKMLNVAASPKNP